MISHKLRPCKTLIMNLFLHKSNSIWHKVHVCMYDLSIESLNGIRTYISNFILCQVKTFYCIYLSYLLLLLLCLLYVSYNLIQLLIRSFSCYIIKNDGGKLDKTRFTFDSLRITKSFWLMSYYWLYLYLIGLTIFHCTYRFGN